MTTFLAMMHFVSPCWHAAAAARRVEMSTIIRCGWYRVWRGTSKSGTTHSLYLHLFTVCTEVVHCEESKRGRCLQTMEHTSGHQHFWAELSNLLNSQHLNDNRN